MTKEITAALCKFMTEGGTIVETETAKIPTKSGSGFQYKYADLSKVLKVVNPALADNERLRQIINTHDCHEGKP